MGHVRWEELTADGFEAAVEAAQGVCILPLGVLEYHGNHLPLGTDMYRAHRMACEVAEREPAVVFPVLPLGANWEARPYPGGVALANNLLFSLLEEVCDEIARNGLKKIVIISGHGGNKWLLPQFGMQVVDKAKDYVPFYCNARGVDPDAVGGYMDVELFNRTFDSNDYGHACEWETSEMLHLHPDLVRMEAATDVDLSPRDRLDHLPNTYTPMDWFSRQPELGRGTPGPATAEKGRAFWEQQVAALAELAQAIKRDTIARDLYDEFTRRIYRR